MRRPHLPALAPAAGIPLLLSGMFMLSGCVSSQDVYSQSAAGAVATPTVEPADVCPPITGDQLTQITGTPFQPRPAVEPSSTDDSTQCQWAATGGGAFVITKTFRNEPESTFKQSMSSAQRNLGPTQVIAVKGARAAFVVPSAARIGILTKDAYVEVNTVIPELTASEVRRISALAARTGADKG